MDLNRKLGALIGILLLFAVVGHAAVASAIQWNVRTDGLDTNGCGFKAGASGTDWTLQAGVQYSVTDGVTAGTTTITSATAAFGTDVVGNVMYVQGGTGSITAGWYEITVRNSSTSVTVDRSTGLTTGTGVTLHIGGACLTISKAVAIMVAGNTINIKAGTYTLTTAIALTPTGSISLPISFIGYNSTPADGGTRPLITTATNSTSLFTINNTGYYLVKNLKFTNTASTKSSHITGITTSGTGWFWAQDCIFDTGTLAIDFSSRGPTDTKLVNNLLQNFTSHAFAYSQSGSVQVYGNVFYNNTSDAINIGGNGFLYQIEGNIFAKNRNGFYDTATNRTPILIVVGNTFDSNTAAGIRSDETTTAPVAQVTNNIFYNNTTYGVNFQFASSGADMSTWMNRCNAYGANGTAARTGLSAGTNDVTLTASPFISTTNWQLNNTAGGGPLLKAVACMATMPDGTLNFHDIGAIQHPSVRSAPFVQ